MAFFSQKIPPAAVLGMDHRRGKFGGMATDGKALVIIQVG